MERRLLRGRAVQVGSLRPVLKAPGTKRLKLECDVLLSTSVFESNLRQYNEVSCDGEVSRDLLVLLAGRCKLPLSKPVLKAPTCMVSALETMI